MANKYKDGDVVTDTEIKETFTYNQKVDGWLAKNRPKQLRSATDHEKNNLIRKGATFIYY